MAAIKELWMVMLMACLAGMLDAQQTNFCSLPAKPGPCKAAFKRYYFDAKSGYCRQFTYGGCQPNANNFATKSACVSACGCSQPLDTGDRFCGPRSRKNYYYFNTDTGSCSRFRYSGCGGNLNKFKRASKCRKTCSVAKCYLPPETGNCRASIPRYFYNSQSGQCEVFYWGGCGGNSNKFVELKDCEKECASKITPIAGKM